MAQQRAQTSPLRSPSSLSSSSLYPIPLFRCCFPPSPVALRQVSADFKEGSISNLSAMTWNPNMYPTLGSAHKSNVQRITCPSGFVPRTRGL